MLSFLEQQNVGYASNCDQRGYQKLSVQKNTPEMNELERDVIPVQFLASNSKKQKS